MASTRQRNNDTQQRVLRYLKLGWPIRKIADTLAISTQSVYYHEARLIEAGVVEPREKERAS